MMRTARTTMMMLKKRNRPHPKQQVPLRLILLSLVASLAGLRFARVAAVPLAMLYFTIPIWDLTIPPLQAIAVKVVGLLVGWTGPVAYTVGNVITIPSGSFEIAEGCSGMRYFMVSLTMAAFIGLSWYDRWSTRLKLLAMLARLACHPATSSVLPVRWASLMAVSRAR